MVDAENLSGTAGGNNTNRTGEPTRINITFLNLRKSMGILGVLLPLILVLGNGVRLEASISHFYYTSMNVVFTGMLITFGLFLISYRGFERKTGEWASDNILTNIAGIMAIVTAFIPTASEEYMNMAPNGHNSTFIGSIHFISAGLFLVLMGYMAFVQFARSSTDTPKGLKRKYIYQLSGIMIWISIAVMAILFLTGTRLTPYDVFIGETVALFFFGIAWLVKGEALKMIGL